MIITDRRNKPPSTNEIKHFTDCKRCAETCPPGVRLSTYQTLAVGFTPYGFQVWCVRHDCNVLHFDFRGNRVVVNAAAVQGVVWPSIPTR